MLSRPEVSASAADNTLLKILYNRRSIRKFTPKEIPDDVMAAILEAGRLAPCTVNLQTWSFFIFTPEEWKKCIGNPIPFKGNRAVLVCGDINRVKPVLKNMPDCPLFEYTTAVINASLASMNMNLAAEALGVSSIMLSETGKTGYFYADYLQKKLDLPNGVFPLLTLVLGYAKGGYPAMPPKFASEYVTFKNKYKKTPMEVTSDWFDKMTAGYKFTFPLKTFKGQLKTYNEHLVDAEEALKKMVFHYGSSAPEKRDSKGKMKRP